MTDFKQFKKEPKQMKCFVTNENFYCCVIFPENAMEICIMDKSGCVFYDECHSVNIELLDNIISKYKNSMAICTLPSDKMNHLKKLCTETNNCFFVADIETLKSIRGLYFNDKTYNTKEITDLFRCNLLPVDTSYVDKQSSFLCCQN